MDHTHGIKADRLPPSQSYLYSSLTHLIDTPSFAATISICTSAHPSAHPPIRPSLQPDLHSARDERSYAHVYLQSRDILPNFRSLAGRVKAASGIGAKSPFAGPRFAAFLTTNVEHETCGAESRACSFVFYSIGSSSECFAAFLLALSESHVAPHIVVRVLSFNLLSRNLLRKDKVRRA